MRILIFCFLLCCVLPRTHAVHIAAPENGISHTSRKQQGIIPDKHSQNSGWIPNNTRRPRTGQSGWQYIPGNRWKAPRDAKAERRRDNERIRRQGGTPRLRFE